MSHDYSVLTGRDLQSVTMKDGPSRIFGASVPRSNAVWEVPCVPGLSLRLYTHHLISLTALFNLQIIGGGRRGKKCHSLPNVTELWVVRSRAYTLCWALPLLASWAEAVMQSKRPFSPGTLTFLSQASEVRVLIPLFLILHLRPSHGLPEVLQAPDVACNMS